MVSLEPQESQTFSAWAITSDFYAGDFFFFSLNAPIPGKTITKWEWHELEE